MFQLENYLSDRSSVVLSYFLASNRAGALETKSALHNLECSSHQEVKKAGFSREVSEQLLRDNCIFVLAFLVMELSMLMLLEVSIVAPFSVSPPFGRLLSH